MAMETRLSLRQSQRVVMTPLLQQAIQHGADLVYAQLRAVLPDPPRLGSQPRVSGFRLPGYGIVFNVDVPMIQMPTQTEVQTHAQAGIQYRRPDSDEPGNRFRLYEVAGMPHNNSREMRSFLGDPCTLPVTDFPAGAFTALGLHHLIEWIANGKTPPYALPIEVDQNSEDGSPLALDEYGNAKGGVRNVWVDVPVAAYGVFGKGKTTAQDRLCQLAGTRVPLPDATLHALYANSAAYVSRVERRARPDHRPRWPSPSGRARDSEPHACRTERNGLLRHQRSVCSRSSGWPLSPDGRTFRIQIR